MPPCLDLTSDVTSSERPYLPGQSNKPPNTAAAWLFSIPLPSLILFMHFYHLTYYLRICSCVPPMRTGMVSLWLFAASLVPSTAPYMQRCSVHSYWVSEGLPPSPLFLMKQQSFVLTHPNIESPLSSLPRARTEYKFPLFIVKYKVEWVSGSRRYLQGLISLWLPGRNCIDLWEGNHRVSEVQ